MFRFTTTRYIVIVVCFLIGASDNRALSRRRGVLIDNNEFMSAKTVSHRATTTTTSSGMCEQVSTTDLENTLGGAFNPKYMSVTPPRTDPTVTGSSNKRGAAELADENFYVENDLSNDVFGETSALEGLNHVALTRESYEMMMEPDGQGKKLAAEDSSIREKRALSESMMDPPDEDDDDESRGKRAIDYQQKWHCPSRVEWMDLGPDYFPRYLRTVVCLKKTCWFDLYHCKARSFAVKLLRRRRSCGGGSLKTAGRVGTVGLPSELRELWVWEEKAVAFCCDCTVSSH